MFCSDPMSGSDFIAQTSKFLPINATAATLGQGHGNVIQYISPDPCIICVKYLRFSWNGFDMWDKSCCGGGRGGNEQKHKVTPDWGDLIICDNWSIAGLLFHLRACHVKLLLWPLC